MKKCIICGCKVPTTVEHSYVLVYNGDAFRKVYSCQGCNDAGKFDTWIDGLPVDPDGRPIDPKAPPNSDES